MIRPILKYGDRGLAAAAQPVAEFDDSVRQLIDDMVETMYAAPGIGLAATQLGISLRVLVIDASAGREGGQLIALVNPEIVERVGTQLEEEGCLSLPGFNATVLRPSRVVLKGYRPRRLRDGSSKARTSSRARFSTRWTISTARCSSIACGASGVT